MDRRSSRPGGPPGADRVVPGETQPYLVGSFPAYDDIQATNWLNDNRKKGYSIFSQVAVADRLCITLIHRSAVQR